MDPGPEISIVVIAYEMGRELPRTLLSLSPGYQARCPPGRCEVIVVDNGSASPPRAQDFVGLGLDLSVQVMPDPTPSPAAAVNRGLSLARGDLVGVWIDGARLASPGLVDACARAAALHPRAVVATYNHHLGPDLQYRSVAAGYDRAEEDRLLEAIAWPTGADRLASVSTREAPRLDGPLLESNALFMRKAMWRELGGYDERFKGPGGGAVNPDMFIRACAAPGAQLIRVLHEGTFHQFHGGATTGAGREGAAAMLKLGAKQYFRLRGRPLQAVRTPGWLFDARAGRLSDLVREDADDA